MITTYQNNLNISGRRSGSERRVFDPNYKGIERRVTKDRRTSSQQRRHQRFRAKDLTFVKLSSEKQEDIGQLIDISKVGLSFRYFLNDERSHNYSNLGIFVSGGNFTIDAIPFKTVSDTELANGSPFSKINLRRYGVQFENLTPDQISKLDNFLKNHTLN